MQRRRCKTKRYASTRRETLDLPPIVGHEETQAVEAGESGAVRLLKEFRFAIDRMFVEKTANAAVQLMRPSWDALLNSLEQFSSDFLQERDQPTMLDSRERS